MTMGSLVQLLNGFFFNYMFKIEMINYVSVGVILYHPVKRCHVNSKI